MTNVGEVEAVKQFDRVVYAQGGQEHAAVALSTPHKGVHAGLRTVSHHLNLIYLDDTGVPRTVMGAALLETELDDGLIESYAKDTAAALHRPGPMRDGAELAARNRLERAPRRVGWRPRDLSREMCALLDERRGQPGTPSAEDLDAAAAEEKAALATSGQQAFVDTGGSTLRPAPGGGWALPESLRQQPQNGQTEEDPTEAGDSPVSGSTSPSTSTGPPAGDSSPLQPDSGANSSEASASGPSEGAAQAGSQT